MTHSELERGKSESQTLLSNWLLGAMIETSFGSRKVLIFNVL